MSYRKQENSSSTLFLDENFSNHVLKKDYKQKIQYYLPAYLRMTVRKIHNIELGSSSAEASGTLICSVYYGGLPNNNEIRLQKSPNQRIKDDQEQWYVNQLMNKMAITLNSQSEFTFASQSDMFLQRALRITHDKKNKLFNYIVRDTFQAQVNGNIVLTPFQTLNLYIQFSLRTIESSYIQNKKKIQLRFNLMDSDQPGKLLIKLRTDAGQYSVAEKLCSIVYLNNKQQYDKNNPLIHRSKSQSKSQQVSPINQNNCTQTINSQIQEKRQFKELNKNQKKLKFWQHAHIKIVLYKHPFTTIFSVMMPMWILATIVQLAFFQQNDLGGTIASVGIALVAYMAFIPTVREKIPPSPQFTFIQFVIVLLLITSMLCVIRGFLNHGIVDVEYIWSDDPIFLISLVLNFSTVAITMILLITFYVYWKKSYTQTQSKKQASFKRNQWRNIKADSQLRNKVILMKQI